MATVTSGDIALPHLIATLTSVGHDHQSRYTATYCFTVGRQRHDHARRRLAHPHTAALKTSVMDSETDVLQCFVAMSWQHSSGDK